MSLRIGLLGAAYIAPRGIVKPVQVFDDVEIVSMAARDRSRAEVFAARADIPTVHDTYDQVVTDPNVDAVYNPLAISGHHEWTIKALNAGKHVLCEKPFAMNEAEAREMADCARENGLVCAEAFHYYYHPLTRRMREIVQSGILGRIRFADAHFQNIVEDTPGEIRYQIELGGGAAMDLGCYPLHFLRHSFGAEPEVISAKTAIVHEHIDIELEAELLFPGDVPARIWSRMNPAGGFSSAANFYGDQGWLKVVNPMVPQREPHLIELVTSWGTRRETLTTRPTFDYQLQAFIDAIEGVRPMPTDAEDGVVSMRVIDNVYRAAGMMPRGEI
ncbi:MAG: Gfo/Idh/MocA family oxidoreductase [Chloroflexi bacterium]|nr:Gfo/Idh/MocA family oxidoreductase [Chloroflexota bacterium]MCY3589199.1 Gfo/Idh/MocA family oxidoreductase [Chloroflexota bacterium]MCY3687322.1 Gfo/Idh/MocA family oxidoreductase [Chloroflexota bacterium]MDE2709555.1 Gfo/Idh/MocA family oxidoreductase [Chloroflexota bacterium]